MQKEIMPDYKCYNCGKNLNRYKNISYLPICEDATSEVCPKAPFCNKCYKKFNKINK